MKPFQAMLPEIPIDRATWTGSTVTKVRRGRAVTTRVTLPNGYTILLRRSRQQGRGHPNALYQHQRA